ncbi:hypothetical protein AB4Y96_09235 [Phyllobacterium sp. TAF24]|uniref:hypothetical protein n=1 Tax=Phyllobacterium sp. TAF24 TaxID=3233068 RepID=UPI003F9C35DF
MREHTKDDSQTEKISLRHEAYNTVYAEAYGLIFKLAYHLEKRENPRLEIFLNDDEAKANEWKVYGTLLDDSDERFAEVRFFALGEEREFKICSLRFRITFVKFHSESYIYPNGSKELLPVYEFLVKSAS